jgi:hypothetical protein
MSNLIRSIILIITLSLSSYVMAEGSGKGGDEFRKTAEKYDAKTDKYRNKGMGEVADLYKRQAEIKRHAAGLADDNRWDDIDWTEYHENETMINEKISHMKAKYKKEKKYKK